MQLQTKIAILKLYIEGWHHFIMYF